MLFLVKGGGGVAAFQDFVIVNRQRAPAAAHASGGRDVGGFGFPEGGGALIQHPFVFCPDLVDDVRLI